MLAHVYNIIIYRGVGAPGHVRHGFYGLNATDKHIISVLVEKRNFPVPKIIAIRYKFTPQTRNKILV